MDIMVGLDQTNHHTLTQKRKAGGKKKEKMGISSSINRGCCNK
jgi:hypothetical protein